MSYLSGTRLHFSGQFLAAPSTVNNDPVHFDNASFLPRYQKYGPGATDGWWNPRGNADFRLIGCTITSAWNAGQPVSNDSVLQCIVADSDTRVPAKLVDLDSEQQMVSEIWGLQVRIATKDGRSLMTGHFKPAAFADIWSRYPQGQPDSFFGAQYQSVLVDLWWGDVSGSPFLTALRAAATSGKLSIKFNVDGYDDNVKSATFTQGRIAGTIGPATASEPEHMVLGRHFMGTPPQVPLNFCCASVDQEAGLIYVDLGNALPTTSAGGPIQNLGTLTLACVFPNNAQNQPVPPLPLGDIAYLDPNWYATTAGVVAVPVTGDNLQTALTNSLGLLLTLGGNQTDGITEPLDGMYARADQFVFRMSPGQTVQAKVYATVFGRPAANSTIVSINDPTQLQPSTNIPNRQPPPVAVPPEAINFPCRVVTDADGKALLPILARDPGNPRGYIDGQVYGVRPMLEATMPPPVGYTFNGTDFISLLVWSGFPVEDHPTWESLQPIFQQYANLYPVMNTFLNLADYDSVVQHRGLLLLAFGLPVEDPNSMPVTRDLSPAKRAAILKWLSSDPPPKSPPLTPAPPAASSDAPPFRGGKGTAIAKMNVRRRTSGPQGGSQ